MLGEGGTTTETLQRVNSNTVQSRETCRESFRELKILTVVKLYILEATPYVHIKAPGTAQTPASQGSVADPQRARQALSQVPR